MLNIGINNSSIMGLPALGRLLRSPPNATKKPVGGSGSGSASEAGRTRGHPCRPGLRRPHGQRPRPPAPQARVGHRSHRFCLRPQGKRTPATRIRNHTSRQTSCVPPFLGTPTCRHSNLGPRPSAAFNEGCPRRCLRRRQLRIPPVARALNVF